MLTAEVKQKMQQLVDTCMGESPAFCVTACPMHTDVRGYVGLINEGDYKGAIKLIREKLLIPGILGRVCAHPCEEQCKRGEVEDAMSIAALKWFAAGYDDENDWDTGIETEHQERVAVIGAGPAGVQAAHDLAKKGYKVTVFEKLGVVGGMLRVGIPSYRLPREIIDFEFSILDKLGVEMRLNTDVGRDVTMEQLREEFDAIFIAIGAHLGIMLPLPGSELDGVLSGVDFLRQVSLGEPVEGFGKRVLVIGGGNVAVDVARTARRLGAEVEMVCLEGKQEMPAHLWEIEETEEEGIRIHNGWGLMEYQGADGRVSGLKVKACTRVFDDKGRLNPLYNDEDTRVIEADTMIMAIGQSADSRNIAQPLGLTVSRGGQFEVDPLTLATNVPGIFAGGDAEGRPTTAIESLAGGHKAAISIHRYLRGEDIADGRELEGSYQTDLKKELNPEEPRRQRVKMRMLDPEERIKSFDEVASVFTEDEARAESDRCLQCECKLCMAECVMLNDYCECPKELFTRILAEGDVDPMIPYSCNMCSQCTIVCPEKFEIKDCFMDIRKAMVKANKGKSPIKGHKAIDMHQALGFSKFFNTARPAPKKRERS